MLHITNGDHAAAALRRAGIRGDIAVWREVLHEGRVPRTKGSDPFVTQFAGNEVTKGSDPFWHERRLGVACGHACEEVVLWFESDLYDHLSILDVLRRRPPRARLVLAGVDEWVGVAELEPHELRELLEEAGPVTPAMLDAAQDAWDAFTSEDPRRLAQVDASAVPGLPDAIARLLEEIPGADGLMRSERQLLAAVAEGATTRAAAFRAAQRHEDRPWLGDTHAFARLDRMAPALLTGEEPLTLTDRGRAVLEGREAWHDRPPLQLGGGVFSGPASAS